MAFGHIKREKLSDSVAREIEEQLATGLLKPGQRLPSEREMARVFQVSRPSIREAIQKLEARKLLESRPGGGTFVSLAFGESITDPLQQLLSGNHETAYDLLEFRHALEGITAYYAAQRATDADRKIIRLRYDRLIAAHDRKDFDAEAIADVDFHLAIAEASHNLVLLHVMRSMFQLLHRSIELSFQKLYLAPSAPTAIPEQHRMIMDAILQGDSGLARETAHDHIEYVEKTLLEMSRRKTREERSLHRLRSLVDGGPDALGKSSNP